MEFFKSTFVNEKSFAKTACSLLSFEGAHCSKVLKREKDSDVRTLIKRLNLSLNNKEERNNYLSILLLILPQCENTIFDDYGEKWFKLCAQAFSSSTRDCEKIAMLKIMTFILKKSCGPKELHTKISKLNNSSFMSYLFSPKIQGALIKPALECLYEYLTLFPGENLKFKTDIEKYVCSFLKCPVKYDSAEVESAAKVFAALPISGSGSNLVEGLERGKQLLRLITFAHRALDVLFDGINETEEYDHSKEEHFIPVETLESAKLLNDPVQLRLSACLLISNSFTFISEILSSTNSTFISISPKVLLTLISRILLVEVKMLNHVPGQEMELLSYLLPPLHIRTVSLLQKIIQCKIGQSFYGIIGEQLTATLKSANEMSFTRSHKNEANDSGTPLTLQGEFVKVIAYKTLTTLIQVSQGRHKLPDDLLSIIKKDIEISKDSVTLKAVKGGELNLNLKKKKKKGYSISVEDLKSDRIITNAELSLRCPSAIAALKLVNALFLYAHHSMQRSLIKGLRDTLVQLLKTSLGGVYVYPEVRASLHEATLSYARIPHPLYPLDYNSVHFALVRGCNDGDPKVSRICVEGLSTLAFIMENPQISRLSDISKLQNQLGLSGVSEDAKTCSVEEVNEKNYIVYNEMIVEENQSDSCSEDDSSPENLVDDSTDNENEDGESYVSNDEPNTIDLTLRCDNKIGNVSNDVDNYQENSIAQHKEEQCMPDVSNINGIHVTEEENNSNMNEIHESPEEISEDDDKVDQIYGTDEDLNENSTKLVRNEDVCIEAVSKDSFISRKRNKVQKPERRKIKKIAKGDKDISVDEMVASLIDIDPDSD